MLSLSYHVALVVVVVKGKKESTLEMQLKTKQLNVQ